MTKTSIVLSSQLILFCSVDVRKLLTATGWWQAMKTNRLTVLSSVSYTTFLPRDATRKRGLCCRPVSVRLSVTLVYCIQKVQDIVKLLSRLGSPIILFFFRIPAPMPNSKLKPVILVAVINECRLYFDFMLPSEFLVKRKSNFLRKFDSCSSIVCHFGFAKCVKCVWQLFIFLLVNLIKFFSIILYIATSYGE